MFERISLLEVIIWVAMNELKNSSKKFTNVVIRRIKCIIIAILQNLTLKSKQNICLNSNLKQVKTFVITSGKK